jgi:hypothetical protein
VNTVSLDRLKNLHGVVMHHGLAEECVTGFRVKSGIALPKAHSDILEASNGIEAYDGFIRLFGIHTDESVDAETWNHGQYWKFAWGGRCDNYWCFGETAWGDQYAYAINRMLNHGSDEVFLLDALSMTARPAFPSFKDFFEKEFMRQAETPYDVTIRQAHAKFGSLENDLHLIYSPSILLGGSDDIEHAQIQNARAAMICNGDIAIQIDAAPPGRSVTGVQSYEDEDHRMRLRLLWA